jgi:hypothetical protein
VSTTPSLRPNHNRAAIKLYTIVALNKTSKSGFTLSKVEAARILSTLLHVHNRTSASWLRGDFQQNPFSRENFLKFVREYRTLPGLNTPKKITELAKDLYGLDFKRAVDLLEPEDRKAPVRRKRVDSKTESLAQVLIDRLKSSPPDEARQALIEVLAYCLK